MKVSAIVLAVLSLSASALAQTTTAPAATTKAPAPTPAATTAATKAPAPSPAATNNKAPATIKLWEVSVERDATFSIEGPICSGSGEKPAGTKCPKTRDVATDRCLKYLPSYNAASGKCVAPVDAECKVIKTGAWGCVWPAGSKAAADAAKLTEAPTKPTTKPGATPTTKPGTPTTAAPTAKPTTKPGNNTGNSTVTVPGNSTRARVNPEDILLPSEAKSLSGADVEGAGSATGTIAGVIAVVAGIACAVTGTIIYRRKKATDAEVTSLESAIHSPNSEAYTHNGVRA